MLIRPADPCIVTKHKLKQYLVLLNLLQRMALERQDNQYYLQTIHSLSHSFLVMAAISYQAVETIRNTDTRSAELGRLFKDLQTAHLHTIESLSQYASMLNVSLGHLNETTRKLLAQR